MFKIKYELSVLALRKHDPLRDLERLGKYVARETKQRNKTEEKIEEPVVRLLNNMFFTTQLYR